MASCTTAGMPGERGGRKESNMPEWADKTLAQIKKMAISR
jgi:hypothetical protein